MSLNSEQMYDSKPENLRKPGNYSSQNSNQDVANPIYDTRTVEPKTTGQPKTKTSPGSTKSFKRIWKDKLSLKKVKEAFSPKASYTYDPKEETNTDKATPHLNHKPKTLEAISELPRKVGGDNIKELQVAQKEQKRVGTYSKQKKKAPPPPVPTNRMPNKHTDDQINQILEAKCQQRRASYTSQTSINQIEVEQSCSNQIGIIDNMHDKDSYSTLQVVEDLQVKQSSSEEKQVILLGDKVFYKSEDKGNTPPLELGNKENGESENEEISKLDGKLQSDSLDCRIQRIALNPLDSTSSSEGVEQLDGKLQSDSLDCRIQRIALNPLDSTSSREGVEHMEVDSFENEDVVFMEVEIENHNAPLDSSNYNETSQNLTTTSNEASILENNNTKNGEVENKPQHKSLEEENKNPQQYFTDGLPPEPVKPVVTQDTDAYIEDCLEKLKNIAEDVTAVGSRIETEELNDDEYCECVENLQKLAVGVDKVLAKGVLVIKDAKKKELRRIHAFEDQLDGKYGD